MLKHAPAEIHGTCSPLAYQVPRGERHVEPARDYHTECSNDPNYVMCDKVASFTESVAELEHANDDIISDIGRGNGDEVELRFLRLHEALLTREDALRRVIANIEDTVEG